MAFGNLNVDTITGSGASSVIVNNGSANVAGFTTGNNIQLLQNGGGIVFSNSSATTNSTLNDYETGSWTPVIASATGTITSYTSSGTYTKIGNLVTLVFTYKITNAGTGSAYLKVNGVPFSASNTNNGSGGGIEGGVTGKWMELSWNSTSQLFLTQYDATYNGATNSSSNLVFTYNASF